MIHEITLSDRLRASFELRIRPVLQERITCEREARESDAEAIAKERSCKTCGDPEGYCCPCEGCGKPICDSHRTVDGYCFPCEMEMGRI